MNDIEKAVAALRDSIRNDIHRQQSGEQRSYSAAVNDQFFKNVSVQNQPQQNQPQQNQPQQNQPQQNQPQQNQPQQTTTASTQNVCKLPLRDLQKKGFVTINTLKNKLTEEYRRVKRPLLKNIHEREFASGFPNVIAVTSSLEGEGKTYSAVNLAMSLAMEKERTVLLVDADVLKGSISKLFSIPRDQAGLTDVLNDDSINLSDVIVQTNVPSLRFVPAGQQKPHASELLSSDFMSRMIIELAERYKDRIIVLDCPPILQTNEANILVDHAGQVVFVVAEEDTKQKLVLNALSHIDESKYVGILLNKSSRRIGNYDYYQTSYY